VVAAPRVVRQVWLQNERGERLGYATSWWNADDLRTYVPQTAEPIGRNMASRRLEVHRDLRGVYRGVCDAVAAGFGAEPEAQLWGRHYHLWHGGRRIALIYEVFSPRLLRYLGPATLSADAATLPRLARSHTDLEALGAAAGAEAEGAPAAGGAAAVQ
jgi:chorismate lyase